MRCHPLRISSDWWTAPTGADDAEKAGETAAPRLSACCLHLGIAEGWFVMGKSTALQSEARATVLETA